MTRTAIRPPVSLAALLALAAFFALAALAGAEGATTSPSEGVTPESFSKACSTTKGEEELVLDADGTLVESICSHGGKQTNWCNWVRKTCTTVLVVPRTDRTDRTGGAGATGGGDAVLDDEP